ncbi:MAG: hypothetical protein Q27BPR15_15175 [Rhodobacter sp. CACIA14H1]|nr:MAG: hypothetical protein Q27BPR15_15175 [Rhodobacter sp. CACIA14H1]
MVNILYLFINLEQDQSRRSLMQRSASRLGLTFQRVSAFDLQRLGKEPTQHAKSTGYRNERWGLRPFEIAVFESHRRAWSIFLQSDAELCVVMEDDLLFAEFFRDAIDAAAKVGDRFDIVKINHSVQPRLMGRPKSISNGHILRPILENVSDAGCYLLTRHAAKVLLQRSQGYSSHLDDFVFSPDRRLRTFQLFQPACGQIIHLDDVAKSTDFTVSTRLLQTDHVIKGPRPFRVWKELRRITKRTGWKIRAFFKRGERVDMRSLLTDFVPIKVD